MKTYANEAELLPDAVAALENSLNQMPGATVSIKLLAHSSAEKMPDMLAQFTFQDKQTTLVGEVKRVGEPQYARSAFHQIAQYRQGKPEAVGVFIAPYISPETAKLCQQQNISSLDLAGNCHFAFDGVYLHVEGRPNPAAHSRPLRSLYQPKAERVLRVLLTHPSQLWRLQRLAQEAGVSVGQVFKVKELLKQKEWLAETDQGISLTDPGELLAAWAEHYRFDKHQAAQFYTLSNIEDFAKLFSTGCRQRSIPCAFTSFAAAARYAPHATYRRTTAYVHHELAEVQALLQLKPFQLDPVETGADVILVSPQDDGVFYGVRERQDVSLASPIQTYLDLQCTGGRGREAAKVLLQKEIIPQW